MSEQLNSSPLLSWNVWRDVPLVQPLWRGIVAAAAGNVAWELQGVPSPPKSHICTTTSSFSCPSLQKWELLQYYNVFPRFFFFFTNQSITFIIYLCSLKLACFKTTCTRVFIDLVGCAVEFWCFKSWAASKHANSVVVRCVFHKAPCSLLNLGGKATKSLLVLNNFYIYGFHHCLCTCGILGYFSRWLW